MTDKDSPLKSEYYRILLDYDNNFNAQKTFKDWKGDLYFSYRKYTRFSGNYYSVEELINYYNKVSKIIHDSLLEINNIFGKVLTIENIPFEISNWSIGETVTTSTVKLIPGIMIHHGNDELKISLKIKLNDHNNENYLKILKKLCFNVQIYDLSHCYRDQNNLDIVFKNI